MNVAVVVGTRPECIKMAPVIKALRKRPIFRTSVISTGQHRDLVKDTLGIFGITPDLDLDVMTHDQPLSKLAAAIFASFDPYLAREIPSLVLAEGDTTSVLAVAIASFHRSIPFGHVEAGLRTHTLDAPFPEEMNRLLVARVAQLHFAPTETARRNLLAEGIKDEQIFLTGNPVIDALLDVSEKELPCCYPCVDGRKLILVTVHRRENFGAPLQRICDALKDIHDRVPDAEFVYPVHPNPNIRNAVVPVLSGLERFHLISPVDYVTLVSLLKKAHVVVTDSGGLQEEAPALAKPVFVLREKTERPEAVDEGVARLVGTAKENISAEIIRVLTDQTAYRSMARGVSPYGDGRAAERIADACVHFVTSGVTKRTGLAHGAALTSV